MHPLLIDLPSLGVSVRTNSALLLLAVLACCWSAVHALRRLDGLDWQRTWPAFLILAVVPWIGGHVHFLLNHWSIAASEPHRIFTPWAGLHAGGVIISLAVSAPLVLGYYRVPVAQVADAMVPTLGLGVIIGRLGCFFEGCCFGRTCSWPWCVSFPRETYIYQFHLSRGYITPADTATAPIHPLQLYFAAMGLALVVLGITLQARKRYDGQVALAALLLFSFVSAVLELVRDDYHPRVYWGPLPQLLWTALAMTVVSALAFSLAQRRHPHPMHSTTKG